MKEWERNGLLVEVIRGIHTFIDADVMIPHVDLTVWTALDQEGLGMRLRQN